VLPKQKASEIDKDDTLVSSELLRKAFLHNALNIPDAVTILKQLAVTVQ